MDSTSRRDAVQAATSFLIHALFVTVGLLLAADLHSSYFAGSQAWEVNPVLAALSEWWGARSALLLIKAIDVMGLLWMYALWRRSSNHLQVASILAGVALVYADVVANNYLR